MAAAFAARLRAVAGSPLVGGLVKLGVSAGLVLLVCRRVGGGALDRGFAEQAWPWVVATALTGVGQIVLIALRWQQILRGLGSRGGFVSAFAVTYMGCFFGALLFGPTGGDVARAMLAPARSLGRTGIVHSVLFERLATAVGLGVAAAPFVALRAGPPGGAVPLLATLAAIPLPFFALGGLAWLARATARRDGMIFVALRELDGSRRCLAGAWPRFAAAVALGAIGQVLVAVEVWCLSHSLGLGVSFVDLAMLMPAVMLLVALPVSAGGWGVREGAMVAALALVGVEPAAALLLSIELGVLTTLVSLPGGAIWLHRRLTRPAHAAA